MESNKKTHNRVPAINEVAASKKSANPKPAKVPKAEKNSKAANVKVVDVLLKQSPEKSPQPNTRLNPSQTDDTQSVDIKLDPTSQLASCQLRAKSSSPTSTPNTPTVNTQSAALQQATKLPSPTTTPNIPAADTQSTACQQPASCQPVTQQTLPPSTLSPVTAINQSAVPQQSTPSEPITVHQPDDGRLAETQSLVNNDLTVHHPSPSSQPVMDQPLNSCQLKTKQLPASSIISDQQPEACLKNIEPEMAVGEITNHIQTLEAEPQLNSLPSIPISKPCSINQQPPAVSPVCSQSPTLPQSNLIRNHVPVNSVPSPPASSATGKVYKSKDEKHKKEDKSVQHVLRALNSLNTTEEKLAALCKKYADMFDENRKLQLLVKQHEKRVQMISREKEQLQSDHSKAILTRSRLESLCRELQKQNKAVKEESIAKMREEEEKRTEISAKFQNTLSEITALMQQNNDKNNKLRDDNLDMTSRLKSVCEQYQLREQQVEKLGKQMELEVQLCDAKLAKAKMEMTAEKEILLREKQQLLLELTAYQTRCQELQSVEVDLRNQIALYNDKYDEFQAALSKSSQVFSTFKVEMEKMSKKITKLEKETSAWKKRWEQSHQAVLEMAVDKQVADQELKKTCRQLTALQSLCRTLQTERAQYLATVKKLEGEGGGELSESEKMVNTESGSETVEALINKIDNQSCDDDVKENRPTNKAPNIVSPVNSSAQDIAPEKTDTSQPTQCNEIIPTILDVEESSENKSNVNSKQDDRCDSSIKVCAVNQTSPTTVSESLANIEACCNSVSSLIAAVSTNDSPSKPGSVISPEQTIVKNTGGDTVTPSTSPEQADLAETQVHPKEPLVPNHRKSDIAPSPPVVNLTEQSSSGEELNSHAAENSTTSDLTIANETALLGSDSKQEIVGSAPKVELKNEKKAPIISDSQRTAHPNGSTVNHCDKKEPKLVLEQKKKESSKKRKK